MNSPIQIVDELSRSDDERVRRSTCVALSALDGDYGPRRLVELGLEDSSDAVRQGVAEELSILPGQNRAPLVSRFHEALDNAPRRAAAYDVLCRMSAAGVNVAERERSRFGRLIRFRSTKRLRRRKTGTEFEALNSCLFGAAIGFFSLLFLTNLLTAGFEKARDLDGTVFLFALAALFTSYVMLIRSGPVGSHFDRSAEIVGEIIGAGLRAAILSIIIVAGLVIVVYLEGDTVHFMDDLFEPFVVGCLLAFFVAVAARSGAILGTAAIASGGPLRRAFAVAVGASLGLIVATLGAAVATELRLDRTDDDFVAVTWLFGCIWSVALAYAFVGRDLFFDARFGRPTLVRLASASLPILVVAASVIWLIPAFVRPAGPTDGNKLVRGQPISLPAGGIASREIGEREIIDLSLSRNTCVSIEATSKQTEFIVLLLGTTTGSILARPGDYPTARWKGPLAPGTYELSAVPGGFLDSIGTSIEATLSSPRPPYRGRVDINDIFPLLIDSLLRRARSAQFPMQWGGAMIHVYELTDAECKS